MMKSFLQVTIFTLFMSFGVALNSVENIDEIDRPLGTVYEGRAAEELLRHISDAPYGSKYVTDYKEPFKFRSNDDYTTSQDAGSSTSYKIKGDLNFNLAGSSTHTSYTQTIHHPRDKYFNDFTILKRKAQSNTVVGHALGAVGILVLSAQIMLFLKTLRYRPINNTSTPVNAAIAAGGLTFAAVGAYLACRDVIHYGNLEEKTYLKSRAKSDQKKYYRYDDLTRECPRPGYHGDLFRGLAISVCVGVATLCATKK